MLKSQSIMLFKIKIICYQLFTVCFLFKYFKFFLIIFSFYEYWTFKQFHAINYFFLVLTKDGIINKDLIISKFLLLKLNWIF